MTDPWTAHQPYAKACVAAIEAAHLTVGEWWAEVPDERTITIWLGPQDTWTYRDCLAWSELKGWYWGPETGPDSYVLETCHSLYDGTLVPDPATVAEWARQIRTAGGPATCRWPDFVRDQDDDDAELLAALAVYAGPSFEETTTGATS